MDTNNNFFFVVTTRLVNQSSHHIKNVKEYYTNRVLELLDMDLMVPMQTEGLGGKKICFCMC